MKKIPYFFAIALIAFSGFAPFNAAKAAASIDDLVKCPDSDAVYYLAEDGNRYVFPNESVFFSWYTDFDEVKTISCSDLASLSIGGLVPYQAGASLVKLQTDPTVYAVEPDGILRPVKDETQAEKLYGENWADFVDDLPDVFFPHYKIETELDDSELPRGMLLKDDNNKLFRVDNTGEAAQIDDLVENSETEDQLKNLASDLEDIEVKLKIDINILNPVADQLSSLLDELLATLSTISVDSSTKLDTEIEIEEKDEEVGQSASEAIKKAEKEILRAQDKIDERTAEGVDVTAALTALDSAETLLAEAQTSYDSGDYDTAKTKAKSAKKSAKNARIGKSSDDSEDENNESSDNESDTDQTSDSNTSDSNEESTDGAAVTDNTGSDSEDNNDSSVENGTGSSTEESDQSGDNSGSDSSSGQDNGSGSESED